MEENDEGGLRPAIDIGRCTYCGACEDFCPESAIRLNPPPEEKSWSEEKIDAVSEKARTGKVPVRGTSARTSVPTPDDLQVLPAQVSRPPIDHYREPCDSTITLGGRESDSMLNLEVPIYIAAMSFGSISKPAKMALARGAEAAGSAVNTGEGGMLEEERELVSNLIAQYASGRFGVSADYLKSSDAIELKIGQGAKAGQGGMLLAEKVDDEISSVRGTPSGTDLISPARHMDIVGPEDLKMKIRQLREIVAWDLPIFVKFAAGRVREDVKIAAKAGADAVVVDGMEGGTGAAPEPVLNHAGTPTIAATVAAHEALSEVGLRDEVDLVISGGVKSGADVAKIMALGADGVAISTAALVALGCRVCGMCNTGICPYGITTQNPELVGRLDIEEGARAVTNLLEVFAEEAAMLAMLAGKTSIANLDKDDLRALTPESSALTGVEMAGRV